MIIADNWARTPQTTPLAIFANSNALADYSPTNPPAAVAAATAAAAIATLASEAEAALRAIRAAPSASFGGLGEPSHQPFDLIGVGPNIAINGSQGFRIAIYELLLYNAGESQTISLLAGTQDLMGPIRAIGAGVGLFLPWQEIPYFTLPAGLPFIIAGSSLAAGPLGSETTGFIKYRMLNNSST